MVNSETNVRIGIIGAGRIAQKFAEGVQHAKGAVLQAVAARDGERAKVFAAKYGMETAYGSYKELVNDPQVDLIYISTPNGLHKEHALLCLQHGKHVICEKPFTGNRQELEEVVAVAKEKNLFLMEAMWTRYFPVIQQVKKLVDAHTIGKIKEIHADFGFTSTNKEDIRFNKSLAGGAVMDVGIYPISLCSFLLGKQPKQIMAVADMADTGVDGRMNMLFVYDEKETAHLSCAITLTTPRNAYIIGEKGWIHIVDPWFAKTATVHVTGEEVYAITCDEMKNGYHFEIEEAAACILAGKTESEWMPLAESVAIMETLDRVRESTY